MGPLGLPEAECGLYSFSQASGTIWSSSGVCATFLTHPPITFAVRKRSGPSQDLGETSAKVASGARLAVVPPVMANMVQYRMFWMDLVGTPVMSDPHW
eukprot:11394867-Heterocapsa_arctica.AAC.1